MLISFSGLDILNYLIKCRKELLQCGAILNYGRQSSRPSCDCTRRESEFQKRDATVGSSHSTAAEPYLRLFKMYGHLQLTSQVAHMVHHGKPRQRPESNHTKFHLLLRLPIPEHP